MRYVLVRFLFCLAGLMLPPGAAQAAAYLFPGNLPSGCSVAGSNTYSCGSLTLAASDTLSLAAAPATINFSGSFTVGSAKVNATGAAADLTLNVAGTLTTSAGARVVAQVNAATIDDSQGIASFVGNLKSTSGGVTLGAGSTVTGNVSGLSGAAVVLDTGAQVSGAVSTLTGAITVYGSSTAIGTIGGNVSSTSGAISLTANTRVQGSISCSCWLGVWNQVSITGTVNATTVDNGAGSSSFGGTVSTSGTLTLGIGSSITGNATSSGGDVNLYANSSVSGLVNAGGWARAWNGVVVGGSVTGYGVDNGAGYASFGGAVTGVSSWVTLGVTSTVNGSVTAGGGDVNLYQGSSVAGNVQASAWVHVFSGVSIGGTTTGAVVDASGGYNSSFGASVTASNGWVNLDHDCKVTGSVTATGGSVVLGSNTTVSSAVASSGGDVVVYSSAKVQGVVSSTGTVYAYANVLLAADVSATGVNSSGGSNVSFGANVYATTGGVNIGGNSTVAGQVRATTGSINLAGGTAVSGSVVCYCTLNIYNARIGDVVDVGTLSDSGQSTFAGSVQTRDAASLGNASTVAGNLGSTENSVTQNTSSVVSGCVRSRTGSITLWWGSSSGGVCCGTGTCGTSCTSNFSGHAMPGACASTLPSAAAEYRFDESTWTGAAGEVKDSSGDGRHATKLANVSLSTTGRLCSSARIPADTSSTSQAVDTGIKVADEIGSHGSIAFWYKTSAAWTSLPAGELFDATAATGKSFHLVRLASGALAFYFSDSWGYLLSVSTSAQNVAANTWVHIAVTWYADLWNGKVQIFVNGTPTSATPYTLGGIDASLGTLYIGDSRANNINNNGTVNSANGLIDEFQIYRTVLSSTEVASIMARTRVCAAPAGTFVAGRRYSFESYDWPGWYVRHQNFVGKLTQYGATPTTLERNDATFVARAGLSDSSCWSFESVNYPGYYLRHSGVDIVLQTYSAIGTYPADATFCLRAGLADTAGISLESFNTPGSFIYHRSDGILGIGANTGSVAYAGTATFNIIAPFAVGMDHIEIRHGTGAGVTCTPSTVSIVACNDASCATPFTGGVTGNLTSSGVNVNWPAGSAFSIPAGGSSTTLALQLTSAGTALLGVTNLSSSTQGSNTCNFGSPLCTFTAADSGLVFDVPDHVSDVANTVSVAAVRKADNAQVCVPAFASVKRSVNFKCAYGNPSSGSLPVRVGGVALNAAGNAAAACDGSGSTLSLDFNANGVASTTVQYADVGAVTLSASYTGSAANGDTGLSLSGSDAFIAAPYRFAVSATSGVLTAGSSFSGTATALNYSGNATPNFGRETVPEGLTVAWVRTSPQGTGAVNGSFSGSLGGFAAGTASGSAFQWSEVGRGDLAVALRSGSYLGSGLGGAGSTAGAPVLCAAEWGTCVVPAGAVATIYYGANGKMITRTGMSGNVWCSSYLAGDPNVGVSKSCWYVLTSGSSAATVGAVGPFKPHHFDLSAGAACGSFSYAAQPFSITATARNAAGATTLNYDGGSVTSPAYAKASLLSLLPGAPAGAISGDVLAASAFVSGIGTGSPAYAFTQKMTAPATIGLRIADADGVSSSGYTEAAAALRSGRLVMSNSFGNDKSSLQIPLQVQYWTGKSWVINSADVCSAIATSAVTRVNLRNHNGSAATWTSALGGLSLSAGVGRLTLGAPSPSGTGTVDVAINLGTGVSSDQSCLSAHQSVTGAGLPWLRSRAGNCAATEDRDPSARASFGVYAPETRRVIHLRELF